MSTNQQINTTIFMLAMRKFTSQEKETILKAMADGASAPRINAADATSTQEALVTRERQEGSEGRSVSHMQSSGTRRAQLF